MRDVWRVGGACGALPLLARCRFWYAPRMRGVMTALNRARELGAEHGVRDAKAWHHAMHLNYGPRTLKADIRKGEPYRVPLPEPDMSGGVTDELLGSVRAIDLLEGMLDEEVVFDAYCAAYREARDRVIREAVTA